MDEQEHPSLQSIYEQAALRQVNKILSDAAQALYTVYRQTLLMNESWC